MRPRPCLSRAPLAPGPLDHLDPPRYTFDAFVGPYIGAMTKVCGGPRRSGAMPATWSCLTHDDFASHERSVGEMLSGRLRGRTRLSCRAAMSHRNDGRAHDVAMYSFRRRGGITMVPAEVNGIRLERAAAAEPTDPVILTPQDRTYLMLRSPEGRRALDIQIGQAEAFAISAALEGKRWDRPMTHDLLAEAIAALGATLRQVLITEYREDGVYIAEIEVTNLDGNAIHLSARPSDAVALALRLDAPILVNEALFADAA